MGGRWHYEGVATSEAGQGSTATQFSLPGPLLQRQVWCRSGWLVWVGCKTPALGQCNSCRIPVPKQTPRDLREVVGSVFQVHTADLESVFSPPAPASGHFASDTVLPTPASPVYAMYSPLLYSLFPVSLLPVFLGIRDLVWALCVPIPGSLRNRK